MKRLINKRRSRKNKRRTRRRIYRKQRAGGTGSVLVLYCYKEDEDTKPNLDYYIKYGIVNNPQIQYRFLINAGTVTSTFPDYSNVKVIRRTENEYDLLTYAWYLGAHLEEADTVFFINSSCKGPIGKPGLQWIDTFRQKLATYDIVAPVFTFNFQPSPQRPPFLHTYMLAMNRRGYKSVLTILKSYNPNVDNVYDLERHITSKSLERGLKVSSLLSRFAELDMSNPEHWNPAKWGVELQYAEFEKPGGYMGGDLDPHEVIFFKNIRRPHKHRPVTDAGIAPSIKKYLDSLV